MAGLELTPVATRTIAHASAPGRTRGCPDADPGPRVPPQPAPTGSASPSIVTFGSQRRNDGRYQFQSPRTAIVAGSRTDRTIVASMRTATASPSPSSWMNANGIVTNARNTTTMIVAALVIVPAV